MTAVLDDVEEITWRNIRERNFYLEIPEPVHIGPTWERDGFGLYIQPEYTLGWQAIKWVEANLLDDEGLPFRLTPEQKRLLLWWYAIDVNGRFVYRKSVVQRLKGWGKDPFAAVIAAIEFVGPCRFGGWLRKGRPEIGLKAGDPIAIEHPRAWVQIAAVSMDQTRNTMKLFPGLFSKKCVAEHGIDIGKTVIYAHGGQRTIEAVTSSPAALEGGRPTFTIKNEALTLDTPIPTPSGWTTMGDLKDGDVIYGSDGQPTTVTKAHEVQHGRRVFEVAFSDGTTIKASDGHLWQTRIAQSGAKPRVRTTLEMVEDGRRFMTPRPGPRAGTEASLPVDPYLLGAWLGDGSTGQPNITVGDDDLEAFEALLDERGIEHHRLARAEARAQRVGFKSEIRNLPCYRDKHIPESYMLASIEQRLELLRGLMDTDGCMSGSQNQAIFVGRERLARDVVALLRGLGQVVGIAEVFDARSRQGSYFRVTFTPHQIQPFALPRKAARVGSSRRDWVSIIEIREIASEPVRCISVDAPDRLFQAGEAGHVTHNTHHWRLANEGHEMSAVITRNAAKAKNGGSRTMSITNAYEPAQDSVAQREREAWEDERDGLAPPTGVLYDSIEAAENAYIYLPKKPDGTDPTHEEIRAYVGAVVDTIRGDASWLDVDSLLAVIFDRSNPLSESRRFYYNQIVTAEDAWLHADAIKALPHPMAREQRGSDVGEESPLLIGWSLVHPTDEIVIFFDGSKSQDSTGLVGCRLSDGYTFLIGVWQRPRGERGEKWLAPREAVDSRVIECLGHGLRDDGTIDDDGRFNVVAFFGDPSHALDDADSTRYWDGLFDRWHRRYKHRLQVWATKTGNRQHSIMWDMSSPTNQTEFVRAAERVRGEIQHVNDIEVFEPEFSICGHPALVQHLRNAKEYPTRDGMSIWKGAREANKKIDLAVCLIGARMLRRMMLNVGVEEEETKAQEVWGRWTGMSTDQYSEGSW